MSWFFVTTIKESLVKRLRHKALICVDETEGACEGSGLGTCSCSGQAALVLTAARTWACSVRLGPALPVRSSSDQSSAVSHPSLSSHRLWMRVKKYILQ